MDESSYLYGKPATDAGSSNEDLREVKVKLPVRQVVALHGMKILQGRNVSEIVAEALERYLEGGSSRFNGSKAAADTASAPA